MDLSSYRYVLGTGLVLRATIGVMVATFSVIDDVLKGGAGNDRLVGGASNNLLTGIR